MRLNDLGSLDDDQLRALRRQVEDQGKKRIDEILDGRANLEEAQQEEPTTRITLVLPWSALVTKNKLRSGKQADIAYHRAVRRARAVAKRQLEARGLGPLPVFRTGRVKVTATLIPPDARWDAHNVLDALLDGLEGAVYRNDAQIKEGHWRDEEPDSEHPRAYVAVEQWEETG